MSTSGRNGRFGTPGGRHRRQLVFSERMLRAAPLRAAVTVFAVVLAGLTMPMLSASADTSPSPDPSASSATADPSTTDSSTDSATPTDSATTSDSTTSSDSASPSAADTTTTTAVEPVSYLV